MSEEPREDITYERIRRELTFLARQQDRERWARGEGLDRPRCRHCQQPMWEPAVGAAWCPDCEVRKPLSEEEMRAYLASPAADWITEGDEEDE